MKILLLLLLPCFCLSSDKSDQLPTITSSPTSAKTVSYHQRSRLRIARIESPGGLHPAVQMAHELRRRQLEEEKFITCCCFKIKKFPAH